MAIIQKAQINERPALTKCGARSERLAKSESNRSEQRLVFGGIRRREAKAHTERRVASFMDIKGVEQSSLHIQERRRLICCA